MLRNKYVYLHKNNGVVVYVGKGSGSRTYSRVSRNKAWLELFKSEKPVVEIICSGLTNDEAFDLEQLVMTYFDNLLNRVTHNSKALPLDYEELSKFYKIDDNSPSGLSTLCGKPAGTITKDGRWQISKQGKFYKAHRIIWVLHTKMDIPAYYVIDHKDRNPLNNKIENLRAVVASENSDQKKTNSGKSDHLREDPALKAFLSKEVKNDSPSFKDYPPTSALVRSANTEFLRLLGIRR